MTDPHTHLLFHLTNADAHLAAGERICKEIGLAEGEELTIARERMAYVLGNEIALQEYVERKEK